MPSTTIDDRDVPAEASQALNAKRTSLDRPAWLGEARKALIAGGIAAVKIGKLAEQLQVTRESFYWHFKNLQELHEQLLLDWESTITQAYAALLDKEHDGAKEFLAMVQMHLDESRYDPAWDAAMRDWARISTAAEMAVRRVDEQIVKLIRQMFIDMGYDDTESLVRARITHFHQVGYYKINPGESPEERLQLVSVYIRLLTGFPLMDSPDAPTLTYTSVRGTLHLRKEGIHGTTVSNEGEQAGHWRDPREKCLPV